MKMKNNTKLDQARKLKDDRPSPIISSLEEIRRVADMNQLRLRHLELAIVNLTSICSAISKNMQSSGLESDQGRVGKLEGEVEETKRRCSPMRSSLDLKSDVLGVQMQQLVGQAAAIDFLKDSKASSIKPSGNVKASSKIPTRPTPKKVQATTNQRITPKSSLAKNMESTTEKKTSKKLINNSIITTTRGAQRAGFEPGQAQPKAKAPPRKKNDVVDHNTKTNAKVSVNSIASKKTKTTLSKVTLNQSAAPNKCRGSIKLTIKANYAHCKAQTSAKSLASTNMNSPSTGSKSDDLRPRRKWSFVEDIAIMK